MKKTRSVRAGASDMGVRGAGEWYSAKLIWKHLLVLEDIHGAGDIVVLESVTSKGEEYFLENPLIHCFSSSRWQEHVIDRSGMRRWIVFVGPLTEEDKTCTAKVAARGSEAVGRVAVTWSTWSTSLSWSAFCYRRLRSPWRGGCAHGHPPMKEITVCATHGLRCKEDSSNRSITPAPQDFSPPQMTRCPISWWLAKYKGEKMEGLRTDDYRMVGL